MKPPRHTVAVRVPASTSNCGAGFDTLGLALQLYNRVLLRRAPDPGPQPDTPADARAQALVAAATEAFFAETRVKPFGFFYTISGKVPVARGLGSSATVRAGIIAGLDRLAETRLTKRRLIALLAGLEGHPDNATPVVLGGFTVSRTDPATGEYVDALRFTVPDDLAFVVASPQIEMPTGAARAALPATLPFADAVRSMNSAAFFVAALAALNYQKLRPAVRDFFHEPYRLPLIPGAQAAIEAGVAAGALTGWLSGSGSSVVCPSMAESTGAAAKAMAGAFAGVGVSCETRVLHADNGGLQVD
ncbi:MAG TPA: homoserine kinase [Opitutaceae bacterium]|nr:homoserine kinase [Opitutaceae bacterium]